MPVAKLTTVDYVVMAIYFAVVLGIGWALRRMMRTSTDFFLSGRSLPPWVTGLAFLSANLGAQEVIGMGASGAKYGIATSHFYWVGAIPAMVFVGIFMMPFYYGSRARSVPEYLKLRFDEKTRTLNAVSFAAMTVFSSGVSMYAMGKLLNLLLGWDFTTSVLVSAAIVLAYVLLGGLTSAIYNEVLQFFMIVFGFAPLVWIGLRAVGGWDGLVSRLERRRSMAAGCRRRPTRTPGGDGRPGDQPDRRRVVRPRDGARLRALVRLLVHRLPGRAARDGRRLDDRRAPHAAHRRGAQDVLPLPRDPARDDRARATAPTHRRVGRRRGTGAGMIPPKLLPSGAPMVDAMGNMVLDYDLATPMMLVRLFPNGMLGLGLTALIASFMSGMAGNVTAFNTVWTYDIYQAHIRKGASDEHYLWMGRAATVGGIALSVAAAYVAGAFNNIMDFLQLIFAFVNAPLFATFALGMFWKRSTGHGAFWGLVSPARSARRCTTG
jgi:SSS family solute:Na+ symporter